MIISKHTMTEQELINASFTEAMNIFYPEKPTRSIQDPIAGDDGIYTGFCLCWRFLELVHERIKPL